ncbi:MAG: glycine--tRNA ligase [archaeon]|nr:glycine--tRNA ligase [archaeon]MCR4323919.1 glycine--tRNA ligase [Nanoarchaeota archaeon]
MFVVKKTIKEKDYYYLQQSKRENGKVISKTIAYLGKTKTGAEKKAKEFKGEDKKDEMEEKKIIISKELTIDELANFCKRKGFVYPSGDLYGGLAGFWDYGPVGSELKKNIKDAWWNFHVHGREDIVGIDGSIITNPQVWEASGHVGNFVDVEVYNKKTKEKKKVDKHELKDLGPEWENKGEFNPMFTTEVGPVKEDSTKAYLRPETAQLIFADFKAVQENARLKLPFGIAQIGKAFRNEIAPRNFLFRSREFEQMEIEYFIDPEKKEECPWVKEVENFEINILSAEMQKNKEEPKRMKIKEALSKKIIMLPWHAYWLATEVKWFLDLGANPNNFRIRQHEKEEKSHYATDTWDVEYKFPFGWKELQGIADRGTFDLDQHEKHSKKDLKIMDEQSGKKILPMVVAEPSLGVERAFLVFLFDAYSIDNKEQIILRLNPKLAPVKAAILPLVKKDVKLVKIARSIYEDLRKEWNIAYDESGSIGRRYARNDEIGTPFCITVDEESTKKEDVTIRFRDTGEQKRIKISKLKETLRDLISGKND